MSIIVDDGATPSQSPLPGARPGLNVQAIINRMGNKLGYKPTNDRFRAACLEWIQDILQEIQLADPLMNRTLVMDAPFTLTAGTDTYDVREAPFSWGNCYAVMRLKFPDISDRVLEPTTPDQYRHRGVLAGDSGEPAYFVKIDQFRIRIVPPPAQAYSGVGDYQQDIPLLQNDQDRVDWPRAWDSVLLKGVLYLGYQWRDENSGAWKDQYRLFSDAIEQMRTTQAVTTRSPGQVVMLRARKKPIIPHDRSADVRRWR
jgi:hypothetical protein